MNEEEDRGGGGGNSGEMGGGRTLGKTSIRRGRETLIDGNK